MIATSFHKFPLLPPEIQLMIWQQAMNDDDGAPRKVRINFHATPFIRTLQDEDISMLFYNFTCDSPTHPDPGAVMLANRQAYDEFHRINPHYIQFRSYGPRIYFNGARDTILMDIRSVFTLGQYLVPDRLNGWGPESFRQLHGFEDIQRLAIPLPNPAGELFPGMHSVIRPSLLGNITTITTTPTLEDDTPGTPTALQRFLFRQLIALNREASVAGRNATMRMGDILDSIMETFFGDQWNEASVLSDSSGFSSDDFESDSESDGGSLTVVSSISATGAGNASSNCATHGDNSVASSGFASPASVAE